MKGSIQDGAFFYAAGQHKTAGIFLRREKELWIGQEVKTLKLEVKR
jgi:hypothetical protein